MKLNGSIFPICTAMLACCASVSYARPVKLGRNYFEFVSAPLISWSDAQTAAAALTYKGLPGYLATVASAAQNAFLARKFTTQQASFEGAWLGGEAFGSGTGGTGCWEAGPLKGTKFSVANMAYRNAYANWGGIEPNNAPSAVYMNVGAAFASIGNGQWADAANGMASADADPVQGYIVEFGPKPREVARPAAKMNVCAIPTQGR